MNSQQAMAIADRFRYLSEQFDRVEVVMQQGNITFPTEDGVRFPCGCHASLYALARNMQENPDMDLMTLRYDILAEMTSYVLAANAMARELGLDNKGELEDWATLNENVWGAPFGAYMFVSDRAINGINTHWQRATLDDIIDRWEHVAATLAKAEENE